MKRIKTHVSLSNYFSEDRSVGVYRNFSMTHAVGGLNHDNRKYSPPGQQDRRKKVEIVDILSKVDTFCQQCKPVSPLNCVEGCEIWRIKNEFLKFNKILGRGKYMHNLLNTLKNSRRKMVMDALSECPYGTKGLQEYLKNNGYRHSKSTIDNEYVEPLIETGLVKRDSIKYHLTLYGTKLQ